MTSQNLKLQKASTGCLGERTSQCRGSEKTRRVPAANRDDVMISYGQMNFFFFFNSFLKAENLDILLDISALLLSVKYRWAMYSYLKLLQVQVANNKKVLDSKTANDTTRWQQTQH